MTKEEFRMLISKSICSKVKIKKQPISPEVKLRRDYMNSHNFDIRFGENGDHYLEVTARYKDDE